MNLTSASSILILNPHPGSEIPDPDPDRHRIPDHRSLQSLPFAFALDARCKLSSMSMGLNGRAGDAQLFPSVPLDPDLTLPRVATTLRTMANGASVIPVVVGALALIGWSMDVEALKRIVPGLTAMNPATAIGFICLGWSLGVLSAGLAGPRAPAGTRPRVAHRRLRPLQGRGPPGIRKSSARPVPLPGKSSRSPTSGVRIEWRRTRQSTSCCSGRRWRSSIVRSAGSGRRRCCRSSRP